MSSDDRIRPFRIDVPEASLQDLRRRVTQPRWPDRETVSDTTQGAQLAKVQELVDYWATDYDWRKLENRLNTLPQFITEIDGLDIHFFHVRSQHANALPLDQTADCLRRVPAADLVSNFPPAAVPAVVDGAVLEEPIGTALNAGRFEHVPILNGTIRDEERIFITAGIAVTSAVVPVPQPVTAESYQQAIASVLDVPADRAEAIAAEYPLAAYPSPAVAISALVGDASFAFPALQLDLLTSQSVPTFAYEFNDDNAPRRFDPPVTGPKVATHKAEWPYLFDLPDAPFQEPFSPDQEALAASMRAAWASFAASGDPSTADVRWPAFDADDMQMLSLVPPQPQVETDFAARHHYAFWAA
jgi:para-nitrobenzyl esterase